MTQSEIIALKWWCSRITTAEIETNNKEAIANSKTYYNSMYKRLRKNPIITASIHEEWKYAAKEGTLAAPIWDRVFIQIKPRYKVNCNSL